MNFEKKEWYEKDNQKGIDPELAKLSKDEIHKRINAILKEEGKL